MASYCHFNPLGRSIFSHHDLYKLPGYLPRYLRYPIGWLYKNILYSSRELRLTYHSYPLPGFWHFFEDELPVFPFLGGICFLVSLQHIPTNAGVALRPRLLGGSAHAFRKLMCLQRHKADLRCEG